MIRISPLFHLVHKTFSHMFLNLKDLLPLRVSPQSRRIGK
jgi:hypothetical protein